MNWSTELFKIVKVNKSHPPTYILEDAEENPIRGNFYEQELQKTSYPDVYLVEKIIDRRKRKGIAEVRVKRLGFDKPTWINRHDVL
jgi:hypothetical protein